MYKVHGVRIYQLLSAKRNLPVLTPCCLSCDLSSIEDVHEKLEDLAIIGKL